MKKSIRKLIESKIGSKFITKEEKDKLRESVLNYDFIKEKKKKDESK
jgi:hypothetical protein